jgi:hypothetical protein
MKIRPMPDYQLDCDAAGGVQCAEGWSLRWLGPELIEYGTPQDACLVNVGYDVERKSRAIYASEASSAWFPRVVEHLCMALPLLPGRYVIV